MLKQELSINGIPAILWGESSDRLFIAIHGNMSSKSDEIIVQFAKEATEIGYQVLSFDLPEHGDRKGKSTLCKVQVCVKELTDIMDYAKTKWNHISLFACSMGAYFSLLAYKNDLLRQCLFLSPVVDMVRMIRNMMTWFNVSEERLETEKEIATPIGHTLYWDYYCYVKAHPIEVWNKPTSILYGSSDDICEFDTISEFTKCFECDLKIMEKGEHYFHTKEQLEFFVQWIKKQLHK